MESSLQNTQLLQSNGLKKTVPRLRVLEILNSRKMATSQPDLEMLIGKEIDRVTLYRTLTTFEDKGIVHKIIDINGKANYALCSSSCTSHKHDDQHLHFNCLMCKNLFCLPEQVLPTFDVPNGFAVKKFECLISGVCSDCSLKSS